MAKSRIKNVLIIILSIFLYLIYGNNFLFLFISSILTYYLGSKISKNKNFFLVLFAYLQLLLPLVFFKYIIDIMKINILIPLGISYYTLALISYISDMYHNKYNPCNNIIDFLTFSFYFPCLFIGPINRYDVFIEKINKISFKKDNIFDGIFRIIFGLIKKLIIANKLSIFISFLSKNTSYNGIYVLIGALIYSILLYCDFSGGIDIVLGISKLFNIELQENFNHPYKSESIKEFWRRWHISLSSWLKDYIYIPLGGNRGSSLLTKINVLITFIISGIWHGLHYILWGIINGILVIISMKTKYKYLNIGITFIIISLLWIFFIYNDTFLSIKMFISIFTNFNINSLNNFFNIGLNIYDYIIVFAFLILVILYENNKLIINKYCFEKKLVIILFLLLMILLFGNYGLDVNSNNFIYGSF